MAWACECQGEMEASEQQEYLIEIRVSGVIRYLEKHPVHTSPALHLVKNSDTCCSYSWWSFGFPSRYKLYLSRSYPDVNWGVVLAYTLPNCL